MSVRIVRRTQREGRWYSHTVDTITIHALTRFRQRVTKSLTDAQAQELILETIRTGNIYKLSWRDNLMHVVYEGWFGKNQFLVVCNDTRVNTVLKSHKVMWGGRGRKVPTERGMKELRKGA